MLSVKLEKFLPDESIIDLNTVNLPHLVFFIIIFFFFIIITFV